MKKILQIVLLSSLATGINSNPNKKHDLHRKNSPLHSSITSEEFCPFAVQALDTSIFRTEDSQRNESLKIVHQKSPYTHDSKLNNSTDVIIHILEGSMLSICRNSEINICNNRLENSTQTLNDSGISALTASQVSIHANNNSAPNSPTLSISSH